MHELIGYCILDLYPSVYTVSLYLPFSEHCLTSADAEKAIAKEKELEGLIRLRLGWRVYVYFTDAFERPAFTDELWQMADIGLHGHYIDLVELGVLKSGG